MPPRHAIGNGRTIRFTLLCALALAVACNDGAGPSGPPADLTLAPIDSGYDFPILVLAPPGDSTRLLVLERGGRVMLRKNGVRQDSAFVNLTALTGAPGVAREYGVLGLAFHPQYATNRRLFAYLIDQNEDTRLVELIAEPNFDHASPTPVRTILQFSQPSYAIHYGGTVVFGADGYLYLAPGDGETGGVPSSPAQDSASLLGKMLRLDMDGGVPYAIPPDNPFAGRPGWRGEIYHVGLRNPYRWSVDRLTGDLWLGDVGEDSWEEVDFAAAGVGGVNFGWPYREGNACWHPAMGCPSAGLTVPAHEYSHSDGCSVIGGVVYRGSAIPGRKGTYLFGDFCRNTFRSLTRSPTGTVSAVTTWAPAIPADNVAGFGEDASGEVYVAMASGRVYRVVAQQ
jgi:glucose/arabinose dehydrogenase